MQIVITDYHRLAITIVVTGDYEFHSMTGINSNFTHQRNFIYHYPEKKPNLTRLIMQMLKLNEDWVQIAILLDESVRKHSRP